MLILTSILVVLLFYFASIFIKQTASCLKNVDNYMMLCTPFTGEPCEVTSVSATQITCITGTKPDNSYTIHPGSRGLLFEKFQDQNAFSS